MTDDSIYFRVGYWGPADERPRYETVAGIPLEGRPFRELVPDLVAMHVLFTAVVADVHHLVQIRATPLAPRLVTELISQIHDPALVDSYQRLLAVYGDAFHAENGNGALSLQFSLEMMRAVGDAVHRRHLEQEVERTVRQWLQANRLETPPHEAISTLAERATAADGELMALIHDSLRELGRTADAVQLESFAGSAAPPRPGLRVRPANREADWK